MCGGPCGPERGGPSEGSSVLSLHEDLSTSLFFEDENSACLILKGRRKVACQAVTAILRETWEPHGRCGFLCPLGLDLGLEPYDPLRTLLLLL